jgi:cobalt-zinc-cadmium efflux system protein
MGHGHHGHSHGPGPAHPGDRNLAVAVAVNLALTVVQIAGGVVSGSTALIADAIHNLSDAISLIIAMAARRVARWGRDETMTFGYGRAEVVAALVNYTTIIMIGLWLLFEGATRLLAPPQVEGWTVVIIAGVALSVDLVTALLTWRMSKDSMNIRAAFLHNLADAMASAVVIVAGTLILLYDWRLVDPMATIGISVYILWHAGTEVGPVIRLLMQGSPENIDNARLCQAIAAVEGVSGVHHLHLWQIDERRISVEAHVVVDSLPEFPSVAARIKTVLARDFGIRHSTLEPETRATGCVAPFSQEGPHHV